MIQVTRFNKEEIVINAELIEMIEAVPDTVITMTTGKKLIVKETKEEIVEKNYCVQTKNFIHNIVLVR